jgi:hypothetical protein
MPRRNYLTVPDELLEIADAIGNLLARRGYSVRVEHHDVAYPYTPTLHARLHAKTLLIDVASKVDLGRATRWSGYGRSCSADTEIALAIPSAATRTVADDDKLRELGIGLYLVTRNTATEAIVPQDMAANFHLPEIASTPQRFRAAIGPSHEKFERGDWREGFVEACRVLEVEARRYLKAGLVNGRVVLITASGRRSRLTQAGVDRLTMGQLRDQFALIQNQNHADSVVHGVLDRVVGDRNAATHNRAHARTELALRRNVGQHMWAIDAALRALLNVPS